MVSAAVIAMPSRAPLSASVTLSTWPEGPAKSTNEETRVPTAPEGAPQSSSWMIRAGLLLVSSTGASFTGVMPVVRVTALLLSL